MKTIEQLEEALEAAHEGQNATDIEMASAELAEARLQAEIDRLRSALRKIIDLPNGVVVGHVSLWRKAVQIASEAVGT